jgi:hypothetical protein
MKIKEERVALEQMINKSTSDTTQNVVNPDENLDSLQSEPLMNVDFDELKVKCEKEARTMIKNAISFMIPMNMINENKYLKDKFKIDAMSLAGMIYQLRSNEIVQKSLMEEINRGASHPRMYEVYTGMSKAIGDLNKQLLQTVEAIRSTYKGFKEDVQEKRTEALGPAMNNSTGMLTTGDGSVVTRGTKELINRVKQAKFENNNIPKDVDDAQVIPINTSENIDNF